MSSRVCSSLVMADYDEDHRFRGQRVEMWLKGSLDSDGMKEFLRLVRETQDA